MEYHAIEGYRLSPQQRELLATRSPGTMVVQVAVRLDGALAPDRLVAALRRVGSRHEILRTQFRQLPGMELPLQVVTSEPLVEVALDAVAPGKSPDVAALLADARRTPFELAAGPLLRCRLIQQDASRHLLLITASALCLDARSLGNLLHAIGTAYERDPVAPASEAGSDDPESDADEVIQYTQFCEWLNQLDDDDDAGRAAAFWQGYLADEVPILRLPLERPQAERDGDAVRAIAMTLPDDAATEIETWLTGRSVAVDRYFLACWVLLLARASGQDHVETLLCGDGRTLAELDDVLGPLTTSVPFRGQVDHAATCAGLLDAVAFHARDALAFQSFCPRDRATGAALHTAFEYVPAPVLRDYAGVQISVIERFDSVEDRVALKLVVEQRTHAGPGARHALRLVYDPHRLAEPVVASLAHALQQLCIALLARPQLPAMRLDLVGAGERLERLRRLGAGAHDDVTCLPAANIVAGFAACAERHPERVAYVYGDVVISYRALDRRANQIARALRADGVQPGMVVALFLDRGPHTLAGLLGILKSGAALLPLDITQPPRRLQAILRDAAPIAVVTRGELCAHLPDDAARRVVIDDPELDRLVPSDPEVIIDPALPAYILYTSGSTGAPKGVVIRHASVMNLARALQTEIYHHGSGPRRVSLNASLTFDSSVKQWTRLLFGDTLIGIPEDVRSDGDRLRAHLEAHRCQVLDCTPSQMKILLDSGLPGGLERVLLGGEAIPASMWQTLLELSRATGCRFFNVYGPTECTVNAVWTPIERSHDDPGPVTPVIGRPIPGCHVAIHDASGNPVPPGFAGELWIGGAGVATGYFHDPVRTAERFVPDPYSVSPGERMYRSGDVARFLPDGSIEFLGRVDHQIKLRGQRIELGEIEAAVRRHPAVKDCAVVLREDRPGDQRLVAYVVQHHRAPSDTPRDPARPGLPELPADSTRYRLPNAMVVAHRNKNETDYLYREIFEKHTYALYGIRLPSNAVVFDVGANIGMYSLYVLQHCSHPRIYAFEPIPPIADLLEHNLRRHGERAVVLRHGLSDQETHSDFAYYPYYSMMSGARILARPEDDVEIIRRYLENEARAGSEQARELLLHADELLRFRFESRNWRCQLRRLTDVIRELDISHIDVLKIDVQRAELDVLRGLAEHDLARIDQIVAEVHQDPAGDSAHRTAEISALLERHGFQVATEQDPLLTGTDRHNLYASRLGLTARDAVRSQRAGSAPAEPVSAAALQQHVAAWLPEYMVPQAVVVVESLPLNRRGKIDRAALSPPEPVHRSRSAPRTAREHTLLALWAEVLGTAELGIDDNFFQLGGHSLLATQLVTRIRRAFAVDLPLRTIFEAPTIAKLARALEVHGADSAASVPLTPVPRDERLPLSFGQQRLWFVDQLEPGATAYNNAFAFRCRGTLDVDHLDRALVAIVTRHEVLRTRLVATDHGGAGSEGPVAHQIIDAPADSYVELVDLSDVPFAEREARAQALRRAEARAPFGLATGPVLRVKVVRLDTTEHLLLFTAHHVACDEWSLPIFANELGAIYNALRAGRAAAVPALPVQYADFAVWQRRWLGSDESTRQLAFWKRELAGLPPVLDLPLDRPRSTHRSYRGRHATFELSADVAARLRVLAAGHSTTPFMLFLAGFAALLARYTGQRDLCIGIPVAGRQQLEAEGLIGFFVNVLPIRVLLSRTTSFAELMLRVREAVLGALAHQDMPFEKIVEELDLPRDMSCSPLFQVSFHLRDAQGLAGHAGDAELALEGVTVEPSGNVADEAPIRYDLSLSIDHRGATVRGTLSYDASLFASETCARMAGHLVNLLAAAAADPTRPLAGIPMMDVAEEQRTIRAWTPSRTELTGGLTLPELWQARVANAPHAPAVCSGGPTLDTVELDALATRIAHVLRARGVGPDRRVAILADRSCELIAGILGTVLAGGAYVPLDPAYPAARLAWMIDDAAPVVVLAQSHLAGSLPLAASNVVLLDGPLACHRDAPCAPLAPVATPDDLVYVLYTSGSTGKPKGVMVSHRSVVNLRAALRRAVYAGGPDRPLRVTVNAPVSFDSSVKQLLTLFDGHCLYPVPEELRRDPERYVAWLGEHRIDVLDATPSLLRLLLVAGLLADPERAPRHVLVGGEAISLALWRDLQSSTDTVFHNVYGPTECTVNATAHTLRPEDIQPVIGRALTNIGVYVLDEYLHPVPPGITGELYIGGAGVARGYHGRPARTAERFLPDPFTGVPGARMYRTGDLGRTLPDGTIVFAGRADSQVKLRGHRVELGEIEATLLAHPRVRQCVAVLQSGGDQLVAYVVPTPGEALSPRAVREFAAAQLPEHMVPGSVTVVGELPLTVNNKLDLAALQASTTAIADEQATSDSERDPIEQVILIVLSELLGRAGIGLDQDFFSDLGGHSLLAIQLVARLRAALGIPVELRAIFDNPTPRRLARMAEDRLRRGAPPAWPPIERSPRGAPLPLSFAQRRLWILDRMEPGSPLYNTPKGVRLPGDLDVAVLERAITELVRRHEPLRTRFAATRGGEPVQIIEPCAAIALRPVDLCHLPLVAAEAEAHRLAQAEALHRFDLTSGPLVRFQLIRLAARDHVLLLNMHHIITDARSLEILWRELRALYDAFAQGQPSPLDEPVLHYADHAAWQHRWLTGGVLDQQLAYWRDRLAGLSALELPTDRPRPASGRIDGRVHRFRIDRATIDALRRVARAHDATLFMALLAAFAALLARACRQEDLAVGTAVSGRAQRETEDMVGFFVNTLVMRCDLSGGPSFVEVLARVRETVLAAYAHQDVPFEKLVEELAPVRDTSRSPLFQVMLGYHELAPRTPVHGSEVAPGFDAVAGVAKFDLTLDISHRTGEDLEAALQYRAALFDPVSVARMARQLQTLIAAVVAGPRVRLRELELCDDDERAAMATWNATGVALPEDCLHEVIAAQAARTSEQVAVVSGRATVSYAELMARANRFAHHLRSRGVGPDVVVGVLLERSSELIEAILGILQAGGAYLLLDPEHPAGRLSFMLRDSGASVLVTRRSLAGCLVEPPAQVICLDSDATEIDRQPSTAPACATTAEHLAYVLYTSGSTGAPKGVMVTHRGLVNYVLYSARNYLTDDHRGTPLHSSIAFDLTVTSMLTPLAAGRAIVLIPDSQRLDALASSLRDGPGFSLVKLTPSHLRVLEQLLAPHEIAHKVGAFVIGGEALSSDALRFWRQHAPGTRLINEYGPTETVVGCCVHEVCDDDLAAGGVPIGRPISNTQLYILDGELRPVPPGIPGELYIGGVQVARGYVARPGLTAERFVPDPFSAVPGARMYRTGDLTRYRPAGDGVIEFLGRSDLQVKIRGFRVELGEIELALERHPHVKQAAVILRDEQLAAYVVVDRDAMPEIASLQEHLRAGLPDYMVPSSVTMLGALPLTGNGKVDRRQLPAPVRHRNGHHVHARYALEWHIWTTMAEVLRTDAFGVTDNFFELGGHSLSAVTLSNLLTERCGQVVPLAAIFQHPTVEGLAGLLARGDDRATQSSSLLVELQPGTTRPPIFWIHPVGGTVFCYAGLARALGPDQPFYAFQSPGLEPGTTPISNLEALCRHYADLLQSRYPHGRVRLGGWSLGGIVAFELARQLVARGRELEPVVLVNSFLLPGPAREPTPQDLVHAFLQHLRVSAADIGLTSDADWNLDQTFDALLRYAKHVGVIPQSVGRDPLRRYFDVFSANVRARREYCARSYSGDVVLFHVADASTDKLASWDRLTGGRIRTIPIPGKHAELMSPPHVHTIATQILALMGSHG